MPYTEDLQKVINHTGSFNYRGCQIFMVDGKFKVLGVLVETPDDINKVINNAKLNLKKSIKCAH